jgi:TonB family protein
VELDLQACVDEIKDNAGKNAYWMWLRFPPVQKLVLLPQPPEEAVLTVVNSNPKEVDSANVPHIRVGGEVSAPVVLLSRDPEFSDEALRAKYGGVCIVSLIVDEYGMPQNLRVVRKLGYGLDEKAIEAVNHFRFKPAMRNGEPIAVMVSIEINFRLG